MASINEPYGHQDMASFSQGREALEDHLWVSLLERPAKKIPPVTPVAGRLMVAQDDRGGSANASPGSLYLPRWKTDKMLILVRKPGGSS
jgi:hypothetical protein